MNTTAKKGFLFSMDLAIAFMAILLMAFLFFAKIGFEKEAILERSRQTELKRFGLFLADSMVKNSAKNTLLGSAAFDEEKHRVVSNRLDRKKLEMAMQLENSRFFASKVSFKGPETEETFFQANEKANGNCVSFDRIVSLDKRKGLVSVTVCEK